MWPYSGSRKGMVNLPWMPAFVAFGAGAPNIIGLLKRQCCSTKSASQCDTSFPEVPSPFVLMAQNTDVLERKHPPKNHPFAVKSMNSASSRALKTLWTFMGQKTKVTARGGRGIRDKETALAGSHVPILLQGPLPGLPSHRAPPPRVGPQDFQLFPTAGRQDRRGRLGQGWPRHGGRRPGRLQRGDPDCPHSL